MNRNAIEKLRRKVDWESDNDQTPGFSCGWNAALDAVLALEDAPFGDARKALKELP